MYHGVLIEHNSASYIIDQKQLEQMMWDFENTTGFH